MGKAKDLTGQRFGRLVALNATEKRMDHGCVVWKCQCDCGNVVEISARRLVLGRVRSCGCLRDAMLKDLTGQRFGWLTVLDYAGRAKELGKSGKRIYWRCRCDCGKEALVSQPDLLNGKTQSCGCLQRERTIQNLELIDGTSVAILERNKGKLRRSNKSGYTGVFQTADGKWEAYINFKKKRYWLGKYEEKKDAIHARQLGEKMHENFLESYHSNMRRTKSR